jgi:hypothetical protein
MPFARGENARADTHDPCGGLGLVELRAVA